MKERLTGAIILVAFLVLLVPELLTGPSPQAAKKPPGEEAGPLRSYTIDLATEGSEPPRGAVSAAVTSIEPGNDASVESAESPAGSAAEEPAAASTGTADGSAGSARSAGVPESEDPPTDRRATVASSEAPDTERPRSAFGPQARAALPDTSESAAPAPSRSAQAAKPAGKTSSEPARPASEPAAVPATPRPAAASPPKGDWMVQLGVFAQRENADRLAKQVKSKGYPVVVQDVEAKSRRLYRVRLAGNTDRASADAQEAKLRAAGFSVAVVPAR